MHGNCKTQTVIMHVHGNCNDNANANGTQMERRLFLTSTVGVLNAVLTSLLLLHTYTSPMQTPSGTELCDNKHFHGAVKVLYMYMYVACCIPLSHALCYVYSIQTPSRKTDGGSSTGSFHKSGKVRLHYRIM